MRNRLTQSSEALISQPAQALYGLGGVGKTEIAAEYAHRWASDYEVIWWVRAEQEDTIRNSIVALGRRMRLPDFTGENRDYSSQTVLDALRNGEPYAKFLLIFDNATQPEIVRRYIPHGNGHVIITSRVQGWRQAVRDDGIEVSQFALDETVAFLRRRVTTLAPAGDGAEEKRRLRLARQLAAALDNLPLAAEHAAAYLTQTGSSVEEYLERFQRDAHDLLGESVDMYYPQVVATTWSLARGSISDEAVALFSLLAFFSPEPIAETLLVQSGRVLNVSGPVGKIVDSVTEYRRAARELARFSLVKLDGIRNTIQVHRVVQAVTKARIEREDLAQARLLRKTVHTLLAASDPLEPEREDNDPKYEFSRQHLLPADALNTDNAHLRNLVINQVRRLALRGGYAESLSLGQAALTNWRGRLGDEDLQVLALAAEVASVLRDVGRYEDAYTLNQQTLGVLSRVYGKENEVYLRCARSFDSDIRFMGRYQEALDHEMELLPRYESVFGTQDHSSLMIRNNIAVSLRCIGRFEEALRWDEETYEERKRLFGYSHVDALISKFAIARDLRRLGRYEESLDHLREVVELMDQKNEPWHRHRLLVVADLAVALRRVGFHEDAVTTGEAIWGRHRTLLGPEHRQTLVVATNLIIDRRNTENLSGAQSLGEETLQAWEKTAGADHPNTHATQMNLATVLRRRGNPLGARELDERALAGFRASLGETHPSSLIVMGNLASDLSALGETRAARELGEATFEMSRVTRGDKHPATLVIMANLSVDRRADGDLAQADALYADVMDLFDEVLSSEHWEARRAAQRGRLDLDIEPMSA
ncbi:tetratricopeptide repeat protein [Nonomuraea gerenzanensis]|nr:tetratricopeptide repeat protein [Nonomuraea gerenzanensis]